IVSVKPLAPASDMVGDNPLIAGTMGVIANVEMLDTPPGLATVMSADPLAAISAAEINAVTRVGLTKVVGRFEPFQRTTISLPKFAPSTINVNELPAAWTDAGEIELMAGNSTLLITLKLSVMRPEVS